jgi:membrane-associated phospholipid phosphatase
MSGEADAREAKRYSSGRDDARRTDRLIWAALAIVSILTVVFSSRVDGWGILILKNAGAAALLVVLFRLRKRRWPRTPAFVLRLTGILFIYAYLNLAVDKLQLVVHGRWLDDTVLSLERTIFGVQPTVWLQQLISKPLTEWMMFAYVFYLPLYPILFGLAYARRGETAAERLFFGLGLANMICNLGFIVFPAAGPYFRLGGEYSVPLSGYIWTSIGEFLRLRVQFVGGTIPSPHCACATVMWLTAYQYSRTAFWILSPVVVSLYLSTVYLRFHYVTDTVLGIAVGLFVVWVTPKLRRR